ncbi:hypothetical protein GGS23DRAFT_253835 [Durotheca rogersii]|uniref:uncharacterized protein n=1 Tax=Durotheca rogersii TaxID=419775 RepID=UPI00221E944D|nr:uncharacterized protein GGS23DRAFT_253835 [Durotheca rogersii]KAI5859913.1 hypothetical protein GGS23DRAFT_253835 [Durotheca rogersii]
MVFLSFLLGRIGEADAMRCLFLSRLLPSQRARGWVRGQGSMNDSHDARRKKRRRRVGIASSRTRRGKMEHGQGKGINRPRRT